MPPIERVLGGVMQGKWFSRPVDAHGGGLDREDIPVEDRTR